MTSGNVTKAALILGALLVFLTVSSREPLLLGKISRFSSSGASELDALKSENEALRALLEKGKELEAAAGDLAKQGIIAPVYSSYPFNFRNILAAARGTRDGVRLGAPVVFHGVLIGKVAEVYGHTSVIETVFDPRWEMAVRVGPRRVDAVFKGGASPTLTLIAKDIPLASGDLILAADKRFPHGVPVGEVGEIMGAASSPFREASVFFSYQINALPLVSILPPLD